MSLFDATNIKSLKLKNRFVRAAIGENTKDGRVNDGILELYTKLAKGGVGTIITGLTLVDEVEKELPIFAIYNDSFIADHKKLTDVVHANGASIIVQLVVAGSLIYSKNFTHTPLGPSAVAQRTSKITPVPATVDQIKGIQNKFAEAAVRAKAAGYDAVEIHAAHGFYLSQWVTPYYNTRTDIYGGSQENRARNLLETYAAIRAAVGSDYPIWAKINANDGYEGEVPFEDVLYFTKKLSEAGIDALEISGKLDLSFPPSPPHSMFLKEATPIAAQVYPQTAVVLTGGNNTPDELIETLRTTKIGYFGLARGLQKNPSWINELQTTYGKK